MIDALAVGEVPTIKDVLVFDSEAFSIEPTTEPNGIRYDLPLGDDIAAYLKEALEAGGRKWQIDEPVREDYGAVSCPVSRQSGLHHHGVLARRLHVGASIRPKARLPRLALQQQGLIRSVSLR
jgi:hypothetical protein